MDALEADVHYLFEMNFQKDDLLFEQQQTIYKKNMENRMLQYELFFAKKQLI